MPLVAQRARSAAAMDGCLIVAGCLTRRGRLRWMTASPALPRPSDRYRLPEDVLVRTLEGEAVLLKLRTNETFSLDEIGTRVLEAVTSSDSLRHAMQIILTEYDVEAEPLWEDVSALVSDLVERGLLEHRQP
jgi:hypothetical protein